MRGGIFESFIIIDIFKYGFNNGIDLDIYFWRDKIGNEIDLLIETGKNKKIIEIKSGQTIIDDYFKGLNYYRAVSHNQKNDFFVIYGGEQTQKRTGINVFGWKYLTDKKNEIYRFLT